MKYSLDQVITFIHAVEAGSFTQAAERLNMSKSIVSQRISALEEYLDTQLFVRTTRKLNVTDAGSDFYHGVKSIFNDIEAAIESVRTHRAVAKGRLDVLMPAGFARSLREKAIPRFIVDHPEVHLRLRIVENPLACLDQSFDCLILPHIKGVPLPDFNYVAKKIMVAPVGVFATQNYIDKHGAVDKPEDLAKHNCVAAFSGPWPFKQEQGALHYFKAQGNVSVNDDGVLKSIILNDLAIGYAYSRLFAEELANGDIEKVLTNFTHLEAEIFALYPQSYYMPYKLRAFLDMLDEFEGSTDPYRPF